MCDSKTCDSKMIEIDENQTVFVIKNNQELKSKIKDIFHNFVCIEKIKKFIEDGSYKDEIFEQTEDNILIMKYDYYINLYNGKNADEILDLKNNTLNIGFIYRYIIRENDYYINKYKKYLEENDNEKKYDKDIKFLFNIYDIIHKVKKFAGHSAYEEFKDSDDIRYHYYLSKYCKKEEEQKHLFKCYEQKHRLKDILPKLVELTDDIKYSFEYYEYSDNNEKINLALKHAIYYMNLYNKHKIIADKVKSLEWFDKFEKIYIKGVIVDKTQIKVMIDYFKINNSESKALELYEKYF